LFACLVVLLAWQDRISSEHQVNKSAVAAYEKENQKSLTTASNDKIFGWPALDVFTAVLAFATIGLGAISIYAIRNQSRETKVLQRAYLSVEPYGIAP
jgi:hypothetical protein